MKYITETLEKIMESKDFNSLELSVVKVDGMIAGRVYFYDKKQKMINFFDGKVEVFEILNNGNFVSENETHS